MTRAGQCSSQMPLWLKWRQAWRQRGQAAGGHRAVFPWRARGNRAGTGGVPLPLHPPRGPGGTYQAVRVLGARAASSTLLMATVGGLRALAASTATSTDSSSHCQTKGKIRSGQQPRHQTLSSITFCDDFLPHPPGEDTGVWDPSRPSPLPPRSWASLRLTALTVPGTCSPAMGVFTNWRTGWAWGEK